MRNFLILSLLLLTSCSTIFPALGGAVGAAAGSAISGPGGAALGAIGGVMTGELMNEDTPASQVVSPSGSTASTIHETKNLVETVGLWYLLIFVLIPFFSKRGRNWFKAFFNSAPKKWVSENWERLNKLEDTISGTKIGKRGNKT